MNKYVTTHFTVLRKTQVLHASGLRIELHNFFCNKKASKKCPSRRMKWSLVFSSINLVMELFINCSELKDKDSVGITTNDWMKVT
jgi:hypothetical protein